jgi:hypothetical protein
MQSQAPELKQLLKDDDRNKAAVDLDAELKLELTDQQVQMLLRFVDAHKRFPTAIELNIEHQIQGSVQRSTLFPVTVLVGAMA